VNRTDVTGQEDEDPGPMPNCSVNEEAIYNPLVCAGNDCPGNPLTCVATTTEPADTGPPYRTSFEQARGVMKIAAMDIATRGADCYSAKCRDDFNKLGATAGMLAGAAARVQFFDATGSTALYADLFAGGPNYAAAQATWKDQSVGSHASEFKAASYLNDLFTTGFARVFLNPQAFPVDTTGSDFGNNWTTMLHELIHNTTNLTDPDIQKVLGLDPSANSSIISRQLKMDCYDQ
jgi:hypothetical protein